jgi:hypothetical protein
MTAKEFIEFKKKQDQYLGNMMDRAAWDEVENLLQEYASQFKYDFSKNCTCKDRIGETWCCNQCGLPVPARYDKPLINQ